MSISANDLTVQLSDCLAEVIRTDWGWLIGPTKHPILVTTMGDAFLQDSEDSSVHQLDAGTGRCWQVATGREEFAKLLGDQEFIKSQFSTEALAELINQGVRLGPGQVHGFLTPPVLGGNYEYSNLEPTDSEVHFSILGQIHQQVKDLPSGTPISGLQFR
jgi:hypothetical protein